MGFAIPKSLYCYGLSGANKIWPLIKYKSAGFAIPKISCKSNVNPISNKDSGWGLVKH
jgi:hypothetical protein